MQARNTTIREHYEQNYTRLCKYFRFRSGTQWAAEDVVQEAYYRAIKYFDRYDDATPFNAWFNRILINALSDYLNQERGHVAEEFEEEHTDGVDCTHYTDHILSQIYERIDKKEEPYKEILSLHFKYSYSPKDISAITSNTANVAYKTIAKFRQELKDAYGTKL